MGIERFMYAHVQSAASILLFHGSLGDPHAGHAPVLWVQSV